MKFIKKLFGAAKNTETEKYDISDFWNWFEKHEKSFSVAVKKFENIEREFFDKLSPQLNKLRKGIFFLTGMYDDQTVELILTPDGKIKDIQLVEQLVASAPNISGWKFTALKPSLDINDVGIQMWGYEFNGENMFFYSNDDKNYPDEVDITIVHEDYTEENKKEIINGSFIFLDNYLGELEFATSIDNVEFSRKENAVKDLVPIGKLKKFIKWRQKEFIEKYEGIRHSTNTDSYTIFEVRTREDKPIIALINTETIGWEKKASHPWIATVEITYDGSANNGMPPQSTRDVFDDFEDELMAQLKDFNGNINIGRETGNNQRIIYFACNSFRKPSKVLYEVIDRYKDKIKVEFNIYKDKYWRTFNRYAKY